MLESPSGTRPGPSRAAASAHTAGHLIGARLSPQSRIRLGAHRRSGPWIAALLGLVRWAPGRKRGRQRDQLLCRGAHLFPLLLLRSFRAWPTSAPASRPRSSPWGSPRSPWVRNRTIRVGLQGEGAGSSASSTASRASGDRALADAVPGTSSRRVQTLTSWRWRTGSGSASSSSGPLAGSSFLGLGVAPRRRRAGVMLRCWKGRHPDRLAQVFPGAGDRRHHPASATSCIGRYLQLTGSKWRRTTHGARSSSTITGAVRPRTPRCWRWRNLKVGFGPRCDVTEVVHGIPPRSSPGRCLAIVGERVARASLPAHTGSGLRRGSQMSTRAGWS